MIFVVNVARTRKRSSSYTTAGSLGCKSLLQLVCSLILSNLLDFVVSTSKAVPIPIIMPVIANYASKIAYYARCSNYVQFYAHLISVTLMVTSMLLSIASSSSLGSLGTRLFALSIHFLYGGVR